MTESGGIVLVVWHSGIFVQEPQQLIAEAHPF
uniref:Uncharacterized protein n=1 Tax=Rhizophora mucronata TaxID=61149 RepID=A0A2P2QPH2_RHIMU